VHQVPVQLTVKRHVCLPGLCPRDGMPRLNFHVKISKTHAKLLTWFHDLHSKFMTKSR
jgi:hypothetical protein